MWSEDGYRLMDHGIKGTGLPDGPLDKRGKKVKIMRLQGDGRGYIGWLKADGYIPYDG